MKTILLFLLALPVITFCQSDTSHKALKKGFYKNYREFITNSPSIDREFSVVVIEVPDRLEKIGVMEVNYELKDEDNPITEKIWGFCDGVSVYVKKRRFDYFNKLEYVGPYSFYTAGYSSVGVGPYGVLLIANEIWKHIEIYVIAENGDAILAKQDYVSSLLSKYPDMQKTYDEDPDKKKNVKKYLVDFNERMKKK